MKECIQRLAMEPPFRILVRAILKRLPVSIATRSVWELSDRPQYLLGVQEAANQAAKQGFNEISVIEFGVAGGTGLIVLQEEAEAVERVTGIKIQVFGFDMGANGLPGFTGDYRDHPDAWQPGDYAMDESKLKSKLAERTTLILGNIKETVPSFFHKYNPSPIGFVSFDLDLYSSTKDALEIFNLPGIRMLWNTPLYFDDIEFIFNHKYAGEFLAISEFNAENSDIKIDRWYGVKYGRPFPERSMYEKFYVAHDLNSITNATLDRKPASLPLNK